QAEVGKPQRNCNTLPSFDFSYGRYTQRTDGGVPEAIGHWNTAQPRTASAQKMPRDFIAMNRGALRAGYSTARDFNLYYRAKDIRCKDHEHSHTKRCAPKIPADMTFGITARPCTPFFDLLQHRYKELWMEQQRARTAAQQLEKKKVTVLQQDKVCETHPTLLWKHPLPAKGEPSRHLPRFQKVGPHLSTFPDHDAHKKTFSA
ncbi:CFA77 protein, partial [Heliornis fulica]|nr:CFA77 protein [Heliornis fulica]